MTVIPASRLSRSDILRIGNNILPEIRAEQSNCLPAPGDPNETAPMPIAPSAALEAAAINRSLVVHGEAIPLAG